MSEFTTILKVGVMMFLIVTMPAAAIMVMAVILIFTAIDGYQIKRLPDDQRLKPLVRRPPPA